MISVLKKNLQNTLFTKHQVNSTKLSFYTTNLTFTQKDYPEAIAVAQPWYLMELTWYLVKRVFCKFS